MSQLTNLKKLLLSLELKYQFIVVACASSLLSAVAVYYTQRVSRKSAIRKIKQEFKTTDDWDAETHFPNPNKTAETALISEQLSRNIAFLGEERVDKIRNSFVIVVGLGGVGSHAAHMLLRSGVEHIRLIDFDQVTLSSLNRHAVATRADVGVPKVVAVKNHLLQTVPHARIETCVEMFDGQGASRLLSGDPAFVLDCIDHLESKAALINYCCKNSIRVISSMGAGAKADPSRIQIADLSETFEDPLARATRRMLKVMKWDRYSKVPVVYSTEKPGSVALLPLDESKVDEAEQYSALPTFRSRILPVLGTIPALFGNAMASYVVTELAGFKTEPLAVQNTKKLFDRIYRDVLTTERKHMGEGYDLPMNARDLGGVYEDVWMAKSVLSGVNVGEKLTLCRWRRDIPANSGNIVCMSRTEAAKHALIEPGQLQASYTAEIHSYVKSRFEAERKMIAWQLQYAKDCAI